jgi:hypothetical protein
MGCQITREGITRDLEQMAAGGIGGVVVFQLGDMTTGGVQPIANNPWASLKILSSEWWAMIGHAVSECHRLGLKFTMHNSPGWSGCGGPWITAELAAKKLVWTETRASGPGEFAAALKRPEAGGKGVYCGDVAVLAVPADGVITHERTIELTEKLQGSGTLAWTIPAGDWTIYRFGYTVAPQSMNGPTQPEAVGPDADTYSAEAMRFHFTRVFADLMAAVPEKARPALHMMHIDSLDTAGANWTPLFPQEFKQRFGYGVTPWLPVWAKRTVQSEEATALFTNNRNLLFQEMLRDRYYRIAQQMAHQHGMRFSAEPHCTPSPAIVMPGIDQPMVEFWNNWRNVISGANPGSGRALGRPIIAAEAFTAYPEYSSWEETPSFLKPAGDAAFASGVNLMVLHSWALQPRDSNFWPGMAMGWWGTHFGYKQTWWEPGKAFLQYLARCQHLLQQGEPVSDALVVNELTYGHFGRNQLDYCSETTLQDARVDNGRVTLPSGRSYPLLVLPSRPAMSAALARKIRELVHAGATILGKRPLHAASPGQPAADTEVRAIGNELWGDSDSGAIRAVGKGRVLLRGVIDAALQEIGIAPDAEFQAAQAADAIRFTHRRDGETDIYFAANVAKQPVAVSGTALFRVHGKQPELWNPVTGEVRSLPEFAERNGRTAVPLEFAPAQSWFVIFRQNAGAPSKLKAANFPKTTPLQEVCGPWEVQFDPKWGGPAGPIRFEALDDWSKRPEPGIKYYSGTAVYRTRFEAPADTPSGSKKWLALGEVRDLARVKLNGQDLGVAWTAPWEVEITSALKPGANLLEIEVSNTWVNRMIGDEQEPDDTMWDKPSRGLNKPHRPIGSGLKAYPDWFVRNEARPSKGRYTFTTWKFWSKADPLLPAGLLGPVRVLEAKEIR